MLRRIRSGRADLALLTLPVEEAGLTAVPVLREELLLIMPPGHELESARHPIDPASLGGEPFILFEAGSNTRRAIDDFFLREQVKPRIVSETENVEIMKAMVANGLGISIVPFLAVANEARTGALSIARIKGPQLVRETGWVYRTGERVPRLLQEMIATMTRILPTLQLTPDSRVVPAESGRPRKRA
jgi:DNA-binding transcriptional LysR family regulator